MSSKRSISSWLFLLLLSVLVGGCASGPKPANPAQDQESARNSRQTPAVQQDGDYGFTVHEVVRIDSDVRKNYQQAIALLETEQMKAGIDLLEDVTERAPDITIPHIDLGVAYLRLERYEDAEAELRAALSLAPNHPVALNEMGILYRKTGRFAAARDSYERALAAHPGFHYALLNLGVLCDLYLEDLNCALENYTSYAGIVTDDPQLGIWIADIRNRLGVEE